MDKEINLEQILESEVSGRMWAIIEEDDMMKEWIVDAMIKACRQILELAAENAEGDIQRGHETCDDEVVINKQSILGTINQIK